MMDLITTIKNDESANCKYFSFAPADSSNLVTSEKACSRAQFWGALSIFVERPNLLNKRLCGVLDLWWGVATETNGFTMTSLKETINFTWEILQKEYESECHTGSTFEKNYESVDSRESTENIYVHQMLIKLKTIFQTAGFVEVNQEEGLRFKPWTQLRDGAMYVVVRRSLPKAVNRYLTTLEAIFIDRDGDQCIFLSNCRVKSSLSNKVLTTINGESKKSDDYPTEDKVSNTSSNNSLFQCNSQQNRFEIEAKSVLKEHEIYCSERVQETELMSDKVMDGASIRSPVAALVPCLPYTLQYSHDRIMLAMDIQHTDLNSDGRTGVSWLRDLVLPRVSKWAQQVSDSGETGSGSSLELVDLQAYSLLYSALKKKYAHDLIQSWQERTNPEKFVHEDIGIATYLLLLWRARDRPQRFLDLGCGNGLLVYLLTSEGHRGTGLDIKRRNIWDTFPSNIDLQEREVRPCDSCLDPNVDWLLGNHSDELTPWIPVMAARTSYTCSFFVLPCCAHDFTARFLRRNSGISQNTDYLNYIEEVGEVCGFVMERDRLRIPSTKRVCFVGQSRSHSIEKMPVILKKVQAFIDTRISFYNVNNLPNRQESVDSTQSSNIAPNCCNGSLDTKVESEQLWGAGFVARPRIQRTRNCTQLLQSVKDDLVRAVVDVVLAADQHKTGDCWRGKSACELSHVAGALGSLRLQQIKQESGGLQTLLRNHRHIFRVERGAVALRGPGCVSDGDSKRHRTCWFAVNHPQGCPNTALNCIYTHPPPPASSLVQ